MRILIVDDESAVRHLVRKTVESLGYEASEAASGADAIARTLSDWFDVIITDLYMADMDGIELIIRLQQQPSTPPLIAMSGGGHRPAGEILELARGLGVAASLSKPFTAAELGDAISVALATGARPRPSYNIGSSWF
jgi:CheY-like chemotaxis protein